MRNQPLDLLGRHVAVQIDADPEARIQVRAVTDPGELAGMSLAKWAEEALDRAAGSAGG